MRKLALSAAAYTLAVICMHFVFPQAATDIIYIVALTLSLLSALLLRGKLRTRLLIVCCFFALGIFRYEVHTNHTLEAVSPFIGNEYTVSAVVTDYPTEYSNCSKIPVILNDNALPKVKAVIYDYNDKRPQLHPGDEIQTKVKFRSSTESYGEETDSYISKGIYLRGYTSEPIGTVSSDAFPILYTPKGVGKWIRDTIEVYSNPRTFAFLSALVTGDKTALYADTEMYYALSRSGLSHVVAVSGMHVSFVLAAVMTLFGNRIGWVFSVFAMILFAVMTGLSPSVMRALFMQSMFLLAPILRREADSITSICVPLLILLLLNPFAVSSISLQLSFGAMLGIILFLPMLTEWFDEKGKRLTGLVQKMYFFVTASFSASLSATVFTAPLCAYHFGAVNIASPISNLLILWMIPYCFVGAFILCLLSVFLPVGAAFAGTILDFGVSFVFHCADFIAGFPYASVYLPKIFMLGWFIAVYVMLILVFISAKKKRMHRFTALLFVGIISLAVLCGYAKHEGKQGITVTAVDVGQGQCIIVTNGDSTLMVDCGGDYTAGDDAVKWLYANGRTQVDALVISHFDKDHVNGIPDLMAQIPVKQVYYCSMHLEEDAYGLLQTIIHSSQFGNTNLNIVNRPMKHRLGDMDITMAVSDGNSSNDGIMVLVDCSGTQTLIMGDADFDAEEDLMQTIPITDGDCLVVGHHGSKYSTGNALLNRFKPEYAIISCGYNSYGHPTKEVLDRLQGENVLIYRTDQMGTIEVKVR